MTDFDSLSQQAARRAAGYWLISRLFLEVPSEPMLREVVQSLGAARKPAPVGEVAVVLDALEAALLAPEAAAVAFTRHLCLGDKEAREPLPFEAHMREGRLPGACTGKVEAMMRAAGYGDVAPEAPSPDHLGAELRFMALLCHDEHQAWRAGDDSAAGKVLSSQRRFLNEHLVTWAPDYCRGLAERTSDVYLNGIARLAEKIIRDDAGVLDEIYRGLAPAEDARGPRQRSDTTAADAAARTSPP